MYQPKAILERLGGNDKDLLDVSLANCSLRWPQGIGVSHLAESTWRIHGDDRKVVPQFVNAKLVQITPITMVFVGGISIVNQVINQVISGGAPPCMVNNIGAFLHWRIPNNWMAYFMENP